MDLRRPLQVVTPTLDGDVLGVLAGADAALTASEIQQLAGRGSKPGIRRVLNRLSHQGIVDETAAGNVLTYRLNRDHVAAQWIEGLASARVQMIARLKRGIEDMSVKPVVALLFGSVARDGGGPESDLDVFVVRPAKAGSELSAWTDQLWWFVHDMTASSGNDVRILEYGEKELAQRAGSERVVADVLRDGIDLTPGATARLRRLLKVSDR